jgi:hypothetical protein
VGAYCISQFRNGSGRNKAAELPTVENKAWATGCAIRRNSRNPEGECLQEHQPDGLGSGTVHEGPRSRDVWQRIPDVPQKRDRV